MLDVWLYGTNSSSFEEKRSSPPEDLLLDVYTCELLLTICNEADRGAYYALADSEANLVFTDAYAKCFVIYVIFVIFFS